MQEEPWGLEESLDDLVAFDSWRSIPFNKWTPDMWANPYAVRFVQNMANTVDEQIMKAYGVKRPWDRTGGTQ